MFAKLFEILGWEILWLSDSNC